MTDPTSLPAQAHHADGCPVAPRPDRELLPVELVDAAGNAIGSRPVHEAHRAPGARHRAFSVLIFDQHGRTLLQQRAFGKTRFPGRWSNTCCGHPEPGRAVDDAARQRLREEMGLVVPLTEVGVYQYHAADPHTGFVEYEWDHVLVGTFDDAVPAPDPSEVAAHRWVGLADLQSEIQAHPSTFSPWLAGVLGVLDTDGSESR